MGLASYLLGIRTVDQIAAHPLVGSLFENLVVMDMRKRMLNRGDSGELYFMRTSHGVEADVVVEREGRLDLTEIKSGATFHDEMADGLRQLRRLLSDEIGDCRVVYSGRVASGSEDIPFVPFDQMRLQ